MSDASWCWVVDHKKYRSKITRQSKIKNVLSKPKSTGPVVKSYTVVVLDLVLLHKCLSTTEEEFFSLLKWKAGRVGCFCREHCETRLRLCREGKKMDQEELWKLNKLNRKMNARKRCAPVR